MKSGRHTVTAHYTRRNGAISGPAWLIREVLDSHHLPYHWWRGEAVIGLRWFDDALAALEAAGVAVQFALAAG